MDKQAKIYVAGHRGMAGSAIVRKLEAQGYKNLLCRTHAELDLTRQADVEAFLKKEQPDYVFIAAAKVGGLFENVEKPAEFIRTNLLIQTNVIDAAYQAGVKKLLFLGSSCTYPLIPDRLIKEEDILTGRPEPTNEAYALAKIAGTRMCEYYRKQYGFNALTIMPPNLMGPNDNFDPKAAHVAQGLMVRMHQAKAAGESEFVIWGSGKPRREYMHADDFADAAVFLMEQDTGEETIFNVGTGEDYSIMELAAMAQKIVGYTGKLVNDPSKADGAMRKTLDSSKFRALGWAPTISIEAAMQETYQAFLKTI